MPFRFLMHALQLLGTVSKKECKGTAQHWIYKLWLKLCLPDQAIRFLCTASIAECRYSAIQFLRTPGVAERRYSAIQQGIAAGVH